MATQILTALFIYLVFINATPNAICGQQQSSSLNFAHLDRIYSYYFPKMLCDPVDLLMFIGKHTNTQIFNPRRDSTTIPILLTFHGLGETPSVHIQRWQWQSYAEQYGFLILSPLGIGSKNPSWNAQTCCGDSLKNNIDDIGFIRQTLYKFINHTNEIFPYINITFSNLILFIAGHSNGGFFTDKIGWIYAQSEMGFPFPITAIAPFSGFINDNQKLYHSNNSFLIHNKVSVFYNHGEADHLVDLKGCGCSNVRCCCDISTVATICTTLQNAYTRWMEWNEVGTEYTNQTIATGNCKFNTNQSNYLVQMCTWSDVGHGIYGDRHVDGDLLRRMVVDFFLHALCIRHNNKWNNERKSCECVGNNEINDNEQIYYCVKDMVYNDVSMVSEILSTSNSTTQLPTTNIPSTNIPTTNMPTTVSPSYHAEFKLFEKDHLSMPAMGNSLLVDMPSMGNGVVVGMLIICAVGVCLVLACRCCDQKRQYLY